MTLNNLANVLSALGRREPALAAAEEAVAIHRELARARPEAFTPYLAIALRTLARCLASTGEPERATAVVAEATALEGGSGEQQ